MAPLTPHSTAAGGTWDTSSSGVCPLHGSWYRSDGICACPTCAPSFLIAAAQGWECCRCHRVHNPTTLTCPYCQPGLAERVSC